MGKDAGLVGHWKLNEKSGTTANDSSRYGNTGTITQGAGKWTDKGYYFDGAATYINCGNNPSLKLGDNFSTGFWFKLSSSTIAGEPSLVVTDTEEYGITFYDVYVALYKYYSLAPGYELLLVPYTFTINWTHLLWTVEGTNSTLYINGALLGIGSYTDVGTGINSYPLEIGKTLTYFTGSIDDVHIYNRALPANEVMRLFNSTKHNYI